MAEHINFEDLKDRPINAEEAGSVYRALEDNAEACPWPIWMWMQEYEQRWGAGENECDLARQVVITAYRANEIRSSRGHPEPPALLEAELDIFAAVGIEPPRPSGVQFGHGTSAQ